MADGVQYDSVWLVFLYVSWLCMAIFTGVDNSYLHQIPLPCSREAWIVPKADKKEMWSDFEVSNFPYKFM